MKRSGPITLMLSVFYMTGASIAQTPVALPSGPSNPVIVTVNFNAAVLATAEARRDLGTLQTKFTPREAQLQKLNDALETGKKQLSDTTVKLSDSEKIAKEQDLNSKEKQLQREAEDFRNDSQSESQQVFQRVAQRLFELLQEYSLQHGYSAVIERGTDSAPIVWYAAANMDITDQIAKAYDLKFGAASSQLPDKPSEGSRSQSGTVKPQASKPTPH
jgi:outer membrane protein